MTTIEIFGFSPSTYTRTARMACIEKGVSHSMSPLAFGKDSHRALHPFLKMPAMRHGDVQLFETLAICTYVDEAFPGPALKPADPQARARMFGWVTAQVDYLYPTLVHGLLADAPPTDADVAITRRHLQVFDDALQRAPWLAGDGPSLADLFLAPMIGFAAGHPNGQALLEGLAGLAVWQARIGARASFKETAA